MNFFQESGGFYDPISKKIYIFASNNTPEGIDETIFHENIHSVFDKVIEESVKVPFLKAFWDESAKLVLYDKTRKNIELRYQKKDWEEELFTHYLGRAMMNGNLANVEKVVDRIEGGRTVYEQILKLIGYDTERETKERASRLGKPEEAVGVAESVEGNTDGRYGGNRKVDRRGREGIRDEAPEVSSVSEGEDSGVRFREEDIAGREPERMIRVISPGFTFENMYGKEPMVYSYMG